MAKGYEALQIRSYDWSRMAFMVAYVAATLEVPIIFVLVFAMLSRAKFSAAQGSRPGNFATYQTLRAIASAGESRKI
jgi:hypothetical protein